MRLKGQTPLHGHRLQTPAADTTNARAQYLDMSRCWDVANFCPLVVFAAGVRVVKFGTKGRRRDRGVRDSSSTGPMLVPSSEHQYKGCLVYKYRLSLLLVFCTGGSGTDISCNH